MAKQFFYGAAGVFLLVAAYQLGAGQARADWVGVGEVVGVADGWYVWNHLGEAYKGEPGHWWREPSYDLPVAASEVKLLSVDRLESSGFLVAHDDTIWLFRSTGWERMPPLPGGPVPVATTSFGSIKAQYR